MLAQVGWAGMLPITEFHPYSIVSATMPRYVFLVVATAAAAAAGEAFTSYECQGTMHNFDSGCEQILSTVVLLQTTHQLTMQEQVDEPATGVDAEKSNRSHKLAMLETSQNRPRFLGHPFKGEKEMYNLQKIHPKWITAGEFHTMMNKPPQRNPKHSREEVFGISVLLVFVVALILLGFLPAPVSTLVAHSFETAYETIVVDKGAAAAALGNLLEGGLFIGAEMPEVQATIQKGGLLALVNSHVQKTPKRVALVDGLDGIDMLYSDVGAAVSNMAKALTSAGLGSGDALALILQPSKALVIASLGAMQAGVAYLPLDPELPSKRVCECLRLARTRLAAGVVPFDTGDVPFWCLGASGEPPVSERPKALLLAVDKVASQDLACIFFTSGSTGVPKGVLYGEDFLLYNTMAFNRLCGVNASTVGLIKTPAFWAVSPWELFSSLSVGGQAVVDARCQKNIDQLANVICASSVSVLVSSGPVLKLLVEDAWQENPQLLSAAAISLKHIVNIGAAIPLDCCHLVNGVLPHASVHNIYGCTESSCTEWTYRPNDYLWKRAGNAPAGRPQPESQIRLLDQDKQPVGVGEIGEVYLGGSFLPLGYLGDPSLTESRFIHRDGLRLYQTGDLGKFVADAKAPCGFVLEITGRADRQLNINGVRVAPEEIESVISQAEGVKEVSVVAAGPSIVAIFAGKGKGDLVEAVRVHCIDRLSTRMRPALTIQLDVLPKLGNGKIDLKDVTERAKEAAAESLVSAVDSLGQMKNVNKEALKELDVLAAIRGLSMMGVICFHWMWQHFSLHMGQNLISPSFQTTFPLWFRVFFRGIMISNWNMMTFVLMSGYTDRKAVEERRPGQVRENVMVFVLYLVCAWPLVPFLDLYNHVNHNDTIVANINGTINGPRWYLLFYLVCRFFSSCVFMPLENRFKGTRTIVLLRVLLVCGALLNAATDPPHIEGGPQLGTALGWIRGWLSPGYAFTKQGNTFFPCYVISWFFGGAIVKVGQHHWPRSVGSWLPGLLFMSCIMYLGTLSEQGKIFLNSGSLVMVAVDLCITLAFILAFAIAAGRPWLRHSQLVKMGQASLGSYAIHFLFWQWDTGQKMFGLFGFRIFGHVMVPDTLVAFEFAREWAGGFGQLIVFFLYPAVFSLTFGVLFQTGFLATFGAVEKGMRRIS
jgi:non-ribosomal peptide synthetase component F